MGKRENTLPAAIAELAATFDASFSCAIYDGQTWLCRDAYGYADRQSGRKLTLSDTGCLSLRAPWLLAATALLLEERGKLKLSDKLSRYYPAYAHADRITLTHLLRAQSGVPDYLLSVVRRELDLDPAYRALSEQERRVREQHDTRNWLRADGVLALISELPLTHEPGLGDEEDDVNRSERALMAGVIEQASGKSLFDTVNELVFLPAGMQVAEGDRATTVCRCAANDGTMFPMPRPEGYAPGDVFTTDIEALVRLGMLWNSGGLLSPASWKLLKKYAATDSPMGFELVDGCLCVHDRGVLGYMCNLFFSQETGMIACYLLNEQQTYRYIDGRMMFLCPCIREEWEGALQKLTAPRFVRIDRINIWNALDLRVKREQDSFVMRAPDAIAYCLADRRCKPYLLVDGTRAIGLLALLTDKKREEYEISIVLIDRRYQGRGYGRFMLEFAVDTLKKAGAKRLSIGVNRENPVARHLYEQVGFIASTIFDGGVELTLEVEA